MTEKHGEMVARAFNDQINCNMMKECHAFWSHYTMCREDVQDEMRDQVDWWLGYMKKFADGLTTNSTN